MTPEEIANAKLKEEEEKKKNAKALDTGDKSNDDPPKDENNFQKLYEDSLNTNKDLEGTNSRLLEECKKHKSQKEKAQEDKLLSEGKKDEVIVNQRTKISEFEKKEEEGSIANAVALEARKRNCEDWDFVFNLADSDMVKYDSETGVVSGVKEFFDEAEKNDRFKKFFSDQKHIDTDNDPPGDPPPKGPNAINYRESPLEYLKACKKISLEEHSKAVIKLKKEGLIT